MEEGAPAPSGPSAAGSAPERTPRSRRRGASPPPLPGRPPEKRSPEPAAQTAKSAPPGTRCCGSAKPSARRPTHGSAKAIPRPGDCRSSPPPPRPRQRPGRSCCRTAATAVPPVGRLPRCGPALPPSGRPPDSLPAGPAALPYRRGRRLPASGGSGAPAAAPAPLRCRWPQTAGTPRGKETVPGSPSRHRGPVPPAPPVPPSPMPPAAPP